VEQSAAADPGKPDASEVVARLEQTVPDVGAAARRALGFETIVLEALDRIVQRMDYRLISPFEMGALIAKSRRAFIASEIPDAIVENPANRVRTWVEIKATLEPLGPDYLERLFKTPLRARDVYGTQRLLLITNQSLTRRAEIGIDARDDVRWVPYYGPEDDQKLEEALRRLSTDDTGS
jgi:hypothetical protein